LSIKLFDFNFDTIVFGIIWYGRDHYIHVEIWSNDNLLSSYMMDGLRIDMDVFTSLYDSGSGPRIFYISIFEDVCMSIYGEPRWIWDPGIHLF